jgi:hypothetical protein
MRLFADQVATIAAWIDLDRLAQTGELVFRNIDVEKSRQIGETWVFAAVICWLLLFHQGIVGGCLHTNGAEIDDGGERNTVKSLFGKIRYIARRLPEHASPGAAGAAPVLAQVAAGAGEGREPRQRRRRLRRRPEGRPVPRLHPRLRLVDEAAFVEHGEQVHAALDDACPDGKAYVSTVNGDDNVHARIADEKPAGWTYLRLHWSTHPIYSKGLHVAAALERDDRGRVTGVAEPGDPDCLLCQGTLAGSSGRRRRRARTATPAS